VKVSASFSVEPDLLVWFKEYCKKRDMTVSEAMATLMRLVSEVSGDREVVEVLRSKVKDVETLGKLVKLLG